MDNVQQPRSERRTGVKASSSYSTWKGMLYRCRNPNCRIYPHYGGRGIVVCERWLKFDAFLADMGERPEGLSIERIDNDGPYSPENCRWANQTAQQRNTRVAKRVTFNGETHHVSVWAQKAGISALALRKRLNRGAMTLEEAMTLPSPYRRRGA